MSISLQGLLCVPTLIGLIISLGPFELTKLSAQVSVLMANQKNVDPKKQAIALSYHNKGTIKTLSNIVKHRGFAGMYTGLNLHLCEYLVGEARLLSLPRELTAGSERHPRNRDLFRYV